ncbi:MAG: hypothetical protein ACK4RV_10285 [Caulobacter sp.]
MTNQAPQAATYETSDTAKAVRMIKAIQSLRDEYAASGDARTVSLLGDLALLPLTSLATLAKAFEAAKPIG